MAWDTGGWGDSLWGGLVGTSVPSPNPDLLPDVHLTIDGQPVRMHQDWLATERVNYGPDKFSARVPWDDIRRHSIGQESEVKLWDQHRNLLWRGSLERDPLVQGEIAELSAVGPAEEAEARLRRALFQTRDYGVWQDRAGEPFVFGVEREYQTTSDEGNLTIIAPRGEAFAAAHADGFAMWAPGTPGGLQRYAFTIRKNRNQGSQDLRAQRFTGPDGTRTDIAFHGLDTGQTLTPSQAISGGEDGLDIVMTADQAFTQGQQMVCRLFNLRVNGIWGNTGRAASYDTMYADEGAAWAFDQMGWGKGGIVPIDTNVLPADFIDGSIVDIVSYFAELVDFFWLPPLEGDGHFRPWGSRKTWRASSERDADFSGLARQRRYNHAIVKYQSVGGMDLEFEAFASPNPFPGVTRSLPDIPELNDVQPNPNLVTQVAQTYANRGAADAWSGSARLVFDDAYLIRPGDHLVQTDAGPSEARTHRVHTKEMRHDGVTVGIESEASVSAMISLAELAHARRRVKPRRKRPRK